eukprot:808713-Lingulodinium_polyedra.AAC.1
MPGFRARRQGGPGGFAALCLRRAGFQRPRGASRPALGQGAERPARPDRRFLLTVLSARASGSRATTTPSP